MKEGGPWRYWILSILLVGSLCVRISECQSYNAGGARGDEGALGFDGILQRHDGYVKGETPTIPQTSFTCSAQPYNPGLYADVETQCQVYHVCFEDRQESFLCGPGTNFNQRILACDFWYNFDCNESPNFYNANADIGKVPDVLFKPGQGRVTGGQQPNYPRQDQPPSVGSIPPRVSIAPPSRNDPQPPVQLPETNVFQPQPPRNQPQPHPPRIQPQPQPPRIQPQPQPPRIQPQPPRIQPQPQPPRIQPQPPRIQPQPQPPRIQPQPPRIQPQPQPPRIQPQPQPPRIQPQPQPPRIQPQPPRIQPQTPINDVRSQYPTQTVDHGSGNRRPQQPYPPSIQQEEDSGYQFDGYQPPKPVSLPLPPPPPPQTPRPSFPPVVSPPRVSRPPLTPPIIRRPEGSMSIPRIPVSVTQSEYHPDFDLKGSGAYQPPNQPRVPEHVDTEYVPPPPPPPPRQPSKPPTSFVPRPVQQEVVNIRPPPPVQQEVISVRPPPPVQQEVTHVRPPPPPSRPYVPPQISQKPVDPNYGRQPPVSPSIVNEQQKPASRPPSRPQITTGGRQPQLPRPPQQPQQPRPPQQPRQTRPPQQPRQPQQPRPVFPPASDHPNSNIKGGPGYNQPPPQIPRFEPARISRPSSPQGGYVPPQPIRSRPEVTVTDVKSTGEKRPGTSTSSGYKPPQPDRIKKPSEPARGVYRPPIQVIDHPRSEIKGADYRDPIIHQQPQGVKSPSTSVSGVKLPQGSRHPQPQVQQRPRAPVVVSRPQPPAIPAAVKRPTPVDSQLYEKKRPQPPAPQPGRIKQPSQIQTVSRPSEPRFPSYQPIDHPNANVKGGGGYNQPRPQSRPSGPPSSPSTAYEQKTTSTGQNRPIVSGGGYPSPVSTPSRGEGSYNPQRTKTAPTSGVKTVSGVKTAGGYQPQSSSQLGVPAKQPRPEYDSGSSYTRGPDIYPKPEFGQPNAPYQPISTPSRINQGTKQGTPSSQNTITSSQVKPGYQGQGTGSGTGTQVRPDYTDRQVPGYQPPNQRQVFPHRENPDHPNESLKGSGAYRPPPPAGFQAAASEVNEQKIVPQPEPEPAAAAPLLGDIGAE